MRRAPTDTLRNGALTLAGVVTAVGMFGPWLRSGASRRSSFELLDLVDRLGFASGGLFEWAVRPWPLAPLIIVASVVAAWSRRHVWAAGFGVGGGVYVGAVALGVSNAPEAGLIRTDWGVLTSLIGGLLLVVLSVWNLLSQSRRPDAAFDAHVA